MVSSPAALRIAKHALAESLVSGARSGDVVMVMGDGSDLSSFHAMAFDTSDRQSFQDVLDTVGSTSSCVASALACTRVYDCIHSAIKCISSDVVQSVSGVEVLIATDLPADAPLPRHYSKVRVVYYLFLSIFRSRVAALPGMLSLLSTLAVCSWRVSWMRTVK